MRALLKKMNIMASKKLVTKQFKEFDINEDNVIVSLPRAAVYVLGVWRRRGCTAVMCCATSRGAQDFDEFEKFMTHMAQERRELKHIIKWIQVWPVGAGSALAAEDVRASTRAPAGMRWHSRPTAVHSQNQSDVIVHTPARRRS